MLATFEAPAILAIEEIHSEVVVVVEHEVALVGGMKVGTEVGKSTASSEVQGMIEALHHFVMIEAVIVTDGIGTTLLEEEELLHLKVEGARQSTAIANVQSCFLA